MSTTASQASQGRGSASSAQDENICMTPPRGGGSSCRSHPSEAASSSWAPPPVSQSRMPTERTSHPSPNMSPTHGSTTTSEAVEKDHNESLQDKALMGLLEVLKFAGGMTLSTTGKIVAPPLHVTRTVLIPSLWAATKDYISINTPQRVKDWFRILSSSVYHVKSVIIATDRGKELQQKIKTVGVDVVDCASNDASRQVFMDGMACMVRLSEALHTPETRALLDQLSILGCRLLDAASTGRTKQLLHDASDCAWSAIELSADPATTLALAEVTAYLCHALEMENALHRPLDKVSDKRRAQRRRDRNRFERQTYIDPHMLQEPDVTVEQAILSSIGGGGGPMVQDNVGGDSSSLPSNVMFPEQHPPGSPSGALSPTHSIKDDGEDEHELEQHWNEEARNIVHVSLLQEKIAERAAQKEQNAFHRTKPMMAATETKARANPREQHGDDRATPKSAEIDATDVEDLALPTLVNGDEEPSQIKEGSVDKEQVRREGATQRARVDLALESNEADIVPNDGSTTGDSNIFDLDKEFMIPLRDPLEREPALDYAEPAIAQFYRTLDEIMAKKRNETVDALLEGQFDNKTDENDDDPSHSRRPSWCFKAAAAAGAGNERGQDTVKEKVSSIRSAMRSRAAIGVGRGEGSKKVKPYRPPTPLRGALDRHTVILGLFLGFLAVVAAIWFGFGCYGIYIYFFGYVKNGSLAELQSADMPAAPAAQEIVVRIVREVVHMTPNGEIIKNAIDDEGSLVASADNIAACVADAIK